MSKFRIILAEPTKHPQNKYLSSRSCFPGAVSQDLCTPSQEGACLPDCLPGCLPVCLPTSTCTYSISVTIMYLHCHVVFLSTCTFLVSTYYLCCHVVFVLPYCNGIYRAFTKHLRGIYWILLVIYLQVLVKKFWG